MFLFSRGPVIAAFLALVLLRPLLDTTWNLKNTSLGFSPLQVVGTLLPVFFGWTFWVKRDKLPELVRGYWEVSTLAVLLLIVSVASLMIDFSGDAAAVAIKSLLLVLLIGFGAVYLADVRFVSLVSKAVVYAAVVPALLVLFEVFVEPIGTSHRSYVIRYTGPYAQVSVYGVYFCMALMGAGYLMLTEKKSSWYWWLVGLITVLGIAAPYLVHMTTWAVLLGLLGLVVLFMLSRKLFWKSALLIGVAVGITFASFQLRPAQKYGDIIGPDVEVLSGERPVEHFGNARGYIWKSHLDTFDSLPVYAKLLGSSLFGRNYYYSTGFGAHNDFLRILLLVGVTGLLLYLIWLGRVTWAVFRLRGELRFLGLAALWIWLGWSLALTPSFIVPLMVVIVPILGSLAEISRRGTPAFVRQGGLRRGRQSSAE